MQVGFAKGEQLRDCGILLTPVERAVGSSKAYRLQEHMTREGARRGAYTLNIWKEKISAVLIYTHATATLSYNFTKTHRELNVCLAVVLGDVL